MQLGEPSTLARLMEAFKVVRQLLDHQNAEVPAYQLIRHGNDSVAKVEDMGPVHSKEGLSQH